MRRKTVTRLAMALGACAARGGEPPALAPLAADRGQPVLALFEHVLTGYFAAAGANGPTACAELTWQPLTADQERALIARFVRLAPAARCGNAVQGPIDTITGEAAVVVRVYEFACSTPDLCSGWAQVPGKPATRYAMRFEAGTWRFDGDRRIIAE